MQISEAPELLRGSEYEVLRGKNTVAARAFVSGRRCVRLLQKHLKLDHFELPSGKHGPVWPRGLAGSISHSKNLVTATPSKI